MRSSSIICLVAFGGAVLVSSCKSRGSASPGSEQKPPAALSSPAPSTAQPEDPHAGKAAMPVAAPKPAAQESELSWEDPKSWKRVPPKNKMRKASYEIPAVGGDSEAAELNVFVFPRVPGTDTIEANMKRWVGQFKDVPPEKVIRTQREVSGAQQHLVEVESATYLSGAMMMPGAGPAQEKPGFGLLGAIVEVPGGDYFFKMTGPSKTIASAKEAFIGLLDSVKLDNKD